MKNKPKNKKIKKIPAEPIVDRLIWELSLLSSKEQLEVVSRGLGVSLDTDNHGQIIIYTDMMYDNGNVIAFGTECSKDHVEYEEEYECEF